MSEKKYQVLDENGNVLASDMNLDIALLLIKACCQEYYLMEGNYHLKEITQSYESYDKEEKE